MRREFLINYCKETDARDFETERALKTGTFLSDGKLLTLNPKMKQAAQNSLGML